MYAYQILNARTGRDKKPQLDVQIRVFRDGTQVYSGQPAPMAADVVQNPKYLATLSGLHLSDGISPGTYVLQVIVTDKLAKKVAAQAIDFEIRR